MIRQSYIVARLIVNIVQSGVFRVPLGRTYVRKLLVLIDRIEYIRHLPTPYSLVYGALR